MRSHTMDRASNWFVINEPNRDAEISLFCLPYAGGSSVAFSQWGKVLTRAEVIAVELPGRARRIFDRPYREMTPLVSDLLQVLGPKLRRPYAVFGHSLGARIGVELMFQLARLGLPLPQHFIASGSSSPHLQRRAKTVFDLPDAEFMQELRHLNGTPDEILNNAELMELCLPMLRADFEIADVYRYTSDYQFRVPATVFGGMDDVDIPRERLQAWQELFISPIDLRMFAGGHFFIDENPGAVIEAVDSVLSAQLAMESAKPVSG